MKNKLYGWQKVYGFSMKQRLKGKGFQIAIAVLFLAALVSMPIVSFIGGQSRSENEKKSKVETLYINDYGVNLSNAIEQILKKSDNYKDIKIQVVTDNTILKELEENTSEDMYLEIEVGMGVSYTGYYGKSDIVSESEAEALVGYISEHSNQMLMYSKGLDDQTIEALSIGYSYEVNQLTAGSHGMVVVEDTEGLAFDEYGFSYTILMAGLLLIMIGSSSVADAVVTEKSTRVIEYLLINIKPMAIVFGKILAAVTMVLLELAAVLTGLVGSVIVNGFLYPSENGTFALPSMVESFLNGSMFEKTTLPGIIVAVLIFLLGVVFYGFVAGIAGASVSRVEDTQEGMKLFTMVSIIGAYLALFLIISESTSGSDFGVLTNVVYLLPLSSPFIIPEYLILGKVSLIMGLLALAIMVVSIILMLILVSNIYGALIYHRGAPLKLKDIIGITKAERGHK